MKDHDTESVSPKHLWSTFAASKPVLMLSVLAGVIVGGSTAGILAIINLSLAHGQQDTADFALPFFALCVLALASGALSLSSLSQLAQENLYELRLWLSHRILAAPFGQLQSCGPHRLMAALTNDIESVVHAQEAFPMLFVEGSKVIAVFVYLGFLSPRVSLFVLMFLVFGVISFLVPQKWTWRWLRLARETDNVLFHHFRAITEGLKELKMDARRRRAFLHDELRGTADALKKQRNKAWLIHVLADRWGQSLFYLLIGAVLFLVPFVQAIPRETISGFTLAILFLGSPISAIVSTIPAIGKGVAALTNIEKMGVALASESTFGEESQFVRGIGAPATLELLGISHQFPAQNGENGYRFGPCDLRIEPGELVFITGGNGSGKTTLALLILGLYVPDTGEIRLGGLPITNMDMDSYRQNFSAVFADAYVFDSLLGYSDDKALARAKELLVHFKLDRKIRIDDGRFSTIDLSRGQRKRLALLVAYLEDRPFYLFDEWTSEQDPIFTEIFYRELLPGLKRSGKTVIVITHDDRYFHLADRLLHLNLGRIEEVIVRVT